MSNTINGGYAKGCGQMILFILVLAGAAMAFATELMSTAGHLPASCPCGDSTNSAPGREAGTDSTHTLDSSGGSAGLMTRAGRIRPPAGF